MTTPSGIPSQIISPEYDVKLPIIDMSHLSKAQKEVELQKIAEAEGARPFALTNQPLWRLALISLQEGEYVLLAVMHHIIFDGWSYGILISEISEYYRALLTNSPVVLPEIDTQYADFAEWQRKQLQGAKLAQLLAYWKKQLADSPLCQVPTDYPRPQVQTFNGAVYQFSFCQELSNSVKAFSIEHNVTLFMTLLSGFVALMRYYVAGDDILIGTDIANRNHPQLEKIIGFFVNQLVLRVRTNGNLTFLELLRTVHEVSTEAYIHQDLPFDKLVETLKPTRALTYSPFFLTKFVLQNASIGELEMPAVEAQPYDVPIRSAKYDILLDLEENASQIAGRLEYSTDLYKTATMTQFIEHYQTILKKVMNEPEIELEVLMEMLRKQDAERADEKRKAFKEMRQQKLRQLRKRSVGGENK